jgi:hypothetical protein
MTYGDEEHPQDIVRQLERETARLADAVRELRIACGAMVLDCPICNGTGENRDAMQAWDIPGAPVPDCHYCKDSRAAIAKTEGLA